MTGQSVPARPDGRAASSASHALLDDAQSVTSARALSVLWGHADHLSLACSDRRLIPALRRLLLTPLLSALYTAKSDIVTLALEQILRLASRHLLVPGSRANDESEEALQVQIDIRTTTQTYAHFTLTHEAMHCHPCPSQLAA